MLLNLHVKNLALIEESGGDLWIGTQYFIW